MTPCKRYNTKYNSLVLLGPTATGKTALACLIAARTNAQIISCDSRQVYKGLDIGSGKDIGEYKAVPNGTGKTVDIKPHLLDITTLKTEYNLFDFQKDFFVALKNIKSQKALPFAVGGTGLYLDSVIRGYDLTPVPENPALRERLQKKTQQDLVKMLQELNPHHHNTSDFLQKERTIRAIEIQAYKKAHPQDAKSTNAKNNFCPLVMGVTLPRDILRQKIKQRLKARFDMGMMQEAKGLLEQGFSHQRLQRLGLEYKFLSEFLEGKIKTYDELFSSLFTAICQFAKRQETWFRGMQKKGVVIHWLPQTQDNDKRLNYAMELIKQNDIPYDCY